MKPSNWEFCTYHIPTDDLSPKKSSDPEQLPVPIHTYSDIFKRSYEVYWLDCDEDRKKNRFMLPTAETALVNQLLNAQKKHETIYIHITTVAPLHRSARLLPNSTSDEQ